MKVYVVIRRWDEGDELIAIYGNKENAEKRAVRERGIAGWDPAVIVRSEYVIGEIECAE